MSEPYRESYREYWIEEIRKEYFRASAQHPIWPNDLIHAVAIMVEESGESMKAALDHVYFDKPIEDVKEELIQTGAMVLRCLINL